MPRWTGTFEERFWEKVDKNGPVPECCPDLGECWLWTAYRKPGCYGLTRGPDLRYENAHRVAWRLEYGDPGSLYVLHHCDNRICVRPTHLFLGSHQDNMDDAGAKGKWTGRNHAVGLMFPQTKLTPEQIPIIRIRYRELLTYEAVAKEFGVTGNAIRQIIVGKSWKHITESEGVSSTSY